MKKFLCVLLVLCLFVTLFAGCKSPEKSSPEEAFVAPENYVSIVQITINPTVNLYLDAQDVILAVEYVNADAKECYAKVEKDIVGKKLDAAVDIVVTTANSDGYFTENHAVKIDVLESKAPQRKELVMSTASSSAKSAISRNSIEAEVKLGESAKENTNKSEGVAKNPGSIGAEDQAEKNNVEDKGNMSAPGSTGQNTTANKGNSDKEVADKIAEMEKERRNPKKNLKKDIKYEIFKLGETDEIMTGIAITFKADGSYSYSQAPYLNDPYGEGSYREYNGKKYYLSGGGGGGGEYTTTDERIIMSGGLEMELSMTVNGELKVEKINGTDDFFKVGNIIQIFPSAHKVQVMD